MNPMASILTAGEALVDLVLQEDGRFLPCLGGAVYNLTRALSRQGVQVAYLNPFSSDRFGEQFQRQYLNDGGLVANPKTSRLPTSLAVVQMDQQGKASYGFYREAVADRDINAEELIKRTNAAAPAAWVMTGCLALDPRDQGTYLPWLKHCRSQERTIVVDANIRMSVIEDVKAYRQLVIEALHLATLIKASDDDLIQLFDLPSDVGREELLHITGRFLAETSAQWFALTLGAQGAWLLHRDGRRWFQKETRAFKVVDTVGAGDCFLAGLLAGLMVDSIDEKTPQKALIRAVASASLCVQREGCQPPSAHEVQRWLAT